MRKITTKDYTVSFEDTQEMRDAVFERVIAFYMKHEAFSGESIMQCDGPQIDAPDLLADLADETLKFHVKWKD